MAVFQPRGSIVEDVIPYILIWMVILPCSGWWIQKQDWLCGQTPRSTRGNPWLQTHPPWPHSPRYPGQVFLPPPTQSPRAAAWPQQFNPPGLHPSVQPPPTHQSFPTYWPTNPRIPRTPETPRTAPPPPPLLTATTTIPQRPERRHRSKERSRERSYTGSPETRSNAYNSGKVAFNVTKNNS